MCARTILHCTHYTMRTTNMYTCTLYNHSHYYLCFAIVCVCVCTFVVYVVVLGIEILIHN